MRETKQIILPQSKIVVEIYTYLSQKGYDEVKKPFIRGMKVTFVEGKGVVSEEDKIISIEAMTEANNANIKYMLHSVDGQTGSVDKLFDLAQELSKKDFNFLVEEINKVTEEDNEEENKAEELKKKPEE